MQGPQSRTRPVLRQLPYALLATGIVLAAPPVTVLMVLPHASALIAVAVCGLLTLTLSWCGDRLWRRRPQSQDVLFGDLMLWGFVRRVRTERRLERAGELFTADDGQLGVVSEERRLAGLERLTSMVESRDAYTHRHSLRVTRYCEGIARRLGMPEEEVERVRTAAALHDVGKYLTPREIINKPGRLTDEEFAVVKQHPGNGASLLAGLVDPQIVAAVRHHHERLSGNGYPDGLKGDEIPLAARIIAVADTFDALTSTRAYRPARPHRKALAILHEEAGTQLDANVVDAFTAYYSGRRGIAVSGAATAATQALLPLRDAVGPSGLARVLPVVGASVALTAPAITAGTPAPPAQHRAAPAGTAAKVEVARVHHRTAPAAAATPHHAEQTAARARPPRTAPRHRAPQRSTPAKRRPPPATTITEYPAGGSGGGQGSGGGGGGDTGTATTTHAQQPAAAAPEPTSAPTSAPTAAPEVAVNPVTVQAGGVTVQTPDIQVNLPDLPVAVPTVAVDLPDIKLPGG